MATLLLIAAGVAVFLWPSPPSGSSAVKPAEQPRTPSYQDSLGALAIVRRRLLFTQSLSEPERKAIDALTLALVNGSDTE